MLTSNRRQSTGSNEDEDGDGLIDWKMRLMVEGQMRSHWDVSVTGVGSNSMEWRQLDVGESVDNLFRDGVDVVRVREYAHVDGVYEWSAFLIRPHHPVRLHHVAYRSAH